MPSLSITGYLRPDTLDDALAALEQGGVAVSGGTAVILHPPPGTRTLVDVAGVLPSGIEERAGSFRIGAMTTLTAMLEHPGLAAVYDGVLADMLRLVDSPLLRNAATIGGHLGRGRLSDVIPLLLALDASVTVTDGGEREMSLEDYYSASLHREPVLVTAVRLPARPHHSAAAFHKFSRTHFDLAMLNGAARIVLGDDGDVGEARVVVGETPSLGRRVAEVEEALAGRPLSPEAIAEAAVLARRIVAVETDGRAGADFRAQLVEVVVGRCLTEAAARLRGGQE